MVEVTGEANKLEPSNGNTMNGLQRGRSGRGRPNFMEPGSQKVAAQVEIIRKRIQQIRDRKEQVGEQNTKATLI
jgi:hypothetical protein